MKKIYNYVLFTVLIALSFIMLLLPNIDLISFANKFTARSYTAFAFFLICVAIGISGKDTKFKLIGFTASAIITYGALFLLGFGIVSFDVSGLDQLWYGVNFDVGGNLFIMFDSMIGISATINTIVNAVIILVPILIIIYGIISFMVNYPDFWNALIRTIIMVGIWALVYLVMGFLGVV
jgi:hypothetical protein